MKKSQLLLILVVLFSCTHVTPPEPVLPLPSERQLKWHELEYYAFVHFNMNTFSDIEWGMGDEDPNLFNPTQLDCGQWARVCKEAGMKGIILTAKHHDGFCLWPTETTKHSVKSSSWKDGKGDVVRELADACKEYDLKLGIYLSPWDRNNPEYGTEKYLEIFQAQLRELMTNYGEVFEVWFDGANGGTGYYGGANEERRIDRKTYYDWENTRQIVRELQPMACMFSDAGPDVRWCGNEEGWVRETNWSIIKRDDFAPGVVDDLEDLRSGQEDGTHWVPAEVDVSIRPGWYYHKYEDHKVKTLPQLLDIYYNSIGRNGSLLINFPVDTRGLIHEKDVEQILKFGEAIKADFEKNLAAGAKAEATNVRGNSKKYQAGNVTDEKAETSWATDDGVIQASLTIDLGEEIEFNRFLVQEDISLGQRVKKFTVETFTEGNWKEVTSQTTIGRKRILRLPNTVASKVRLTIVDSKACPVISNIELYKAPKVLVEPEISRTQNGLVSITVVDNSVDVFYTTDGTLPTLQSAKYNKPFILPNKAVVQAIVADSEEQKQSPAALAEFDVVKSKWQLFGTYKNTNNAEFIFDGNPNTTWIEAGSIPLDVIIDLGETLNIAGFKYLPDQRRANQGLIFNYEFYVSKNGKNWGSAVSKGEFSNIKNSPLWQKKEFEAIAGRYIKLKAITTADENNNVGIAEFDIITK